MTTKEQIELIINKLKNSPYGSDFVVLSIDEAKYILESLKDLETLQKAAGEILLRNEVKEIIKNI